MESNEQTTTNYRLFLMDDAYKEKSNLKRYVSEAQDFYNGKQYPNENYRNMVRVTMNFCSFSSNLKAAKVVGTQRYITFTADDVSYDCRKLQRFDEYNMKKLDESTEDFQTCLDGFNNGTAVVCYRWDEDDTTYKGIYKGGLALDQIDILRFAVANPHLKGIQNQKWVMYWKDEDVSAVRDMVERDSKKELEEARKAIVPDSYDPKTASDNEDVSHGLVTVYTRYFRIGGEVYFMSSTKTVDLYERPHALNPRLNELADEKARKEMAEGSRVEDYSSMDPQDPSFQVADAQIMDDGEYGREKEKFSLYPFAEFRPYAINNSFYGRSDIKDMIPIQKGVNFALSMTLKCVENNAYNKIFAKEGALEGQTITNEPGQVLTDHSRMTNGWGIKFAESQPMPNGVVDFTERLFQMTRIVYGFNDVMDGSVNNQDLSGYAVQQMIKQANSSIEQQQQLFWKFCKDKAAIRLQFYKFYVDSAKYSYEMPDYEVDREEQARKALQARQSQLQGQNQSLSIGDVDLSTPTRKVQIRDFKGSEIYGTRFDIEIDVMQGLADSKLAESQMWDTLIMNGNIQNLTPEMLELYLEANPTISERTKATLKNVVERQKRSENEQLKGKLQEALQYLQKVTEYAKELEAQNGYKTNYINNLTKEFTEKIGVANKVIGAQNKALAGQTKEQQSIQNSKNASKGDFDPGAGGTMA
jgi:hypothetical protein